MKKELTAERLREVLHYDPETGVFTWAKKVSAKTHIGRRAGTEKPIGYRFIGIDGGRYLEHRLAVLHVSGSWPEDEVDHKNGRRNDNRYENLRPCTHAENHQNREACRGRGKGLLGVSWHKLRGKWRACIGGGKNQKHLGLFDTAEEASAAYLAAKSQLHTFQPTPRGT